MPRWGAGIWLRTAQHIYAHARQQLANQRINSAIFGVATGSSGQETRTPFDGTAVAPD